MVLLRRLSNHQVFGKEEKEDKEKKPSRSPAANDR
jgi:hypothetical protein